MITTKMMMFEKNVLDDHLTTFAVIQHVGICVRNLQTPADSINCGIEQKFPGSISPSTSWGENTATRRLLWKLGISHFDRIIFQGQQSPKGAGVGYFLPSQHGKMKLRLQVVRIMELCNWCVGYVLAQSRDLLSHLEFYNFLVPGDDHGRRRHTAPNPPSLRLSKLPK